MKLVKITPTVGSNGSIKYGNSFYISPDQVLAVWEHGGQTYVEMATGNKFGLDMPIQEFIDLMEAE